MDIFTLFSFAGGLGLFLFGMNVMGESIARQAGGKLKTALERITSSKVMGVLLGAGVTAIIQSSGATTVMIIGFINSGIMTLENSLGLIFGANIGTTVTAWLLALNDISGTSLVLRLLNPDSFVPLLAFIGAVMLVFCKRDRTHDFGTMLLGFAVLMFGMSMMSDAMSPLRESAAFREILTLLSNPFLGILFGFVMAAVLQSSSASVGIVQAAAVTGVIGIGNALPLIMGINIGAGIIVLVASAGTNRDAKRAAWVYMIHNTISAAVGLIVLCALRLTINPAFLQTPINSFEIAILHTIYKSANTAIQLPFYRQIIALTRLIIRPGQEEQMFALLDDNFLKTPPVAVARCAELANEMAELTRKTLRLAIGTVRSYDAAAAKQVRNLESEIDVFEDKIGNYLMKLSGSKLSVSDSKEVTRILHSISDLERVSDHARNIMESGEELVDKGISFSEEAMRSLEVIFRAVEDVMDLAVEAFIGRDTTLAYRIDPLEQVVDDLKDKLRIQHVARLKQGICSLTLGFVYTDILTDLERVSDHCSNLAMGVIQLTHAEYEPHSYVAALKGGGSEFDTLYQEYTNKYTID